MYLFYLGYIRTYNTIWSEHKFDILQNLSFYQIQMKNSLHFMKEKENLFYGKEVEFK